MPALKRRRKSISVIFYIFYVLLVLVLIGDVVGAMLYLKLDEVSMQVLVDYAFDNVQLYQTQPWSFNDIFYEQFMYQGSLWLSGLTVVGVIVNLFLIFLKGVIAGFNLIFIFDTLPLLTAILTSLLWFIQYGLILGVTVLMGYFSIRFVLIAIRVLFIKKEPKLMKKQLIYYFYQLVIVSLLTLVSSTVTYLIQPIMYNQFQNAQSIEHEDDISDKFEQNSAEFKILML